MTNPWKVEAKGSALPRSGDLAPGMPVREREPRMPRIASKPKRPRVRHSDLAPICTLSQSDLEPPSEIGIDSRDGPFLVLEFDPGLPMTVIYQGRRFVYHHRKGERAYYHVGS